MQKCIHFTYIPVTIPYSQIFTRLGYSKEKTKISQKEEKDIKSQIQESAGIIRLKGAGLRIKVESITADKVYVNNYCFTSRHFSAFAGAADELLIMGVTGSKPVMDKIRDLTATDFSKALIFDAAASEIVDTALDWITGYFRLLLLREGKGSSKNRFSAGYGDFALENQRFFYENLDMQKLGVELTPVFQLIPEKSVTAAAVIYKKVAAFE